MFCARPFPSSRLKMDQLKNLDSMKRPLKGKDTARFHIRCIPCYEGLRKVSRYRMNRIPIQKRYTGVQPHPGFRKGRVFQERKEKSTRM